MKNVNHLYSVRKQEDPYVIMNTVKKLLKHVGKEGYRMIWDTSFMYATRFFNKKYISTKKELARWCRDRCNRVSIDRLEKHAGTLLKNPEAFRPEAYIIPNPYSHCGIDIDYQSELDICNKHYDSIILALDGLEKEIKNRSVSIGAISNRRYVLKNYLK